MMHPTSPLKNPHDLKTPLVIALPFMHGVECIILSKQKREKNIFDLVTLTFGLRP